MLSAIVIDLMGRTSLMVIAATSLFGLFALIPHEDTKPGVRNAAKNIWSMVKGLGFFFMVIVAFLAWPFICAWFSRVRVTCVVLLNIAWFAIMKLLTDFNFDLSAMVPPSPGNEARPIAPIIYLCVAVGVTIIGLGEAASDNRLQPLTRFWG